MKQEAFLTGASRSSGSFSWNRGLLPFSLAVVAVFCVAAGVNLLWHHWRGEPRAYRAAAGLTLVALGLWQVVVARHVAQRRSSRNDSMSIRRTLPWRWMLVGIVITYGLGLILGPDSSVRYLCRAVLAGWYTLALVPLVLKPEMLGRLKAIAGRRPVRWGSRLAVVVSSLAVTVEVSLRTVALLADKRLADVAAVGERKLAPGTSYHGRTVNQLGYWDDEFQMVSSAGRFRIAALGQGVLLSGDESTNCLVQIERRVPGIEIYNFGLAQASPRDYAVQLKSDVTPYRPDLVLAFLSMGSDITSGVESPGAYDWRSLCSVQWGANYLGLATRRGLPSLATHDTPDYESYLRSLTRRLAVCRTPIDVAMRRQWDQAIEHLDDLVRQCRRREIALGLVLVPSEFQVNKALCEALRRRAGYEPEQVDLELPQRRLSRFAHERNLPLIDLLPHFRATAESPYCRHQGELNNYGNEVATKVIGAWLQARYGTQIAALTQAKVD